MRSHVCEVPRVVLLTDRAQLRLGRGLVRTVAECASAGLAAVVVREHDLCPRDRAALVAALAGIDGLLVVSSRIPEPDAHGHHLAGHQDPTDALGARPWGRSCHDPAEVAVAAAAGASWAFLSPYAVSGSKPGHLPVLPEGAFVSHALPVLALGGIDPSNAADAVGAGAHGVAVMGAVMRASEPARVVEQLIAAIDVEVSR